MSILKNYLSIPHASILRRALVVTAMTLILSPAAMANVQVTVNIQNLAPTNSVSFTPLNLGFHQGILIPSISAKQPMQHSFHWLKLEMAAHGNLHLRQPTPQQHSALSVAHCYPVNL